MDVIGLQIPLAISDAFLCLMLISPTEIFPPPGVCHFRNSVSSNFKVFRRQNNAGCSLVLFLPYYVKYPNSLFNYSLLVQCVFVLYLSC